MNNLTNMNETNLYDENAKTNTEPPVTDFDFTNHNLTTGDLILKIRSAVERNSSLYFVVGKELNENIDYEILFDYLIQFDNEIYFRGYFHFEFLPILERLIIHANEVVYSSKKLNKYLRMYVDKQKLFETFLSRYKMVYFRWDEVTIPLTELQNYGNYEVF